MDLPGKRHKNNSQLKTIEKKIIENDRRSGIERREKIETLLRKSEERYKRLLRAVSDYIYTVKIKNGSVVSTSHGSSCVAVTGYTSEDYEADPLLWYKMIHEEDREYVLLHINRVLSGETNEPLEHRIIHKNGSVRWIRNSFVPYMDEHGRIFAYDGIVSDITEKKKIEHQLYHSLKMEAIGRFAGCIVHDFNNCLTAIIGLSEMAMIGLDGGSPVFQKLEKIYERALRAAEITRQLLALSRKHDFKPIVLNINRLISNMDDMLKHLMGEDIKLLFDFAKDIYNIKIDPGQMEQVLMNLLANARDAMPNGGILTIKTRNVDFNNISDGIRQREFIELMISDTGIGMSDEIRKRVFEPFFTTKENGKGTGLGLSMAYEIIKQNGGKITVSSEKGKGSTFRIYLPAVRSDEEVTHTVCQVVSTKAGSGTILVAEDDAVIRKLTEEVLEKNGYKVYIACDGNEALKILERINYQIDLVLTDIIMPGLSGRDLASRLNEVKPDIKILFMSGYTDEMIAGHGITRESVEFIGKPFLNSELLSRIKKLLNPSSL